MRFPVKLNFWPSFLGKKNMPDPRYICQGPFIADEFERSISRFNIDDVWKTTERNRHPLTDAFILKMACNSKPLKIVEIGASCGITSMELMQKLDFAFDKYYVTDLYFRLFFAKKGKTTYFYHPMTGNCLMAVNNKLVAYENINNSLFLFGALSRFLLKRAPTFGAGLDEVSFIHPTLLELASLDKRIQINEYNVFSEWKFELVDIIRVANLFNSSYFSDDKLRTAFTNLLRGLKVNGSIIVTDNRDIEKYTVLKKERNTFLKITGSLNGGAEIENRILNLIK